MFCDKKKIKVEACEKLALIWIEKCEVRSGKVRAKASKSDRKRASAF